MCKIHDTFTPASLFLPDTTLSQQEICMMHVRALTNVNTTEAWLDRNGYVKGSNGGFSKHASKTQTQYKSRATSEMARRKKKKEEYPDGLGEYRDGLGWATLSFGASGPQGMLKSDHELPGLKGLFEASILSKTVRAETVESECVSWSCTSSSVSQS